MTPEICESFLKAANICNEGISHEVTNLRAHFGPETDPAVVRSVNAIARLVEAMAEAVKYTAAGVERAALRVASIETFLDSEGSGK